MKKTITVNLNGRVFTMDDDAYRLLDNYLHNLRIYFRKEEGASEIIADFEARIEELFSEKTRLGAEVITIEQVEEVIARVGNPADFAESDEAKEEKQTYFTKLDEVKKKFYRNVDDKMFGGVCSGVAAYYGWDVLPVRIVSIVLLFATSFWIVPVYLLVWILLPGAYTAEQKLQMRGKPITVENIGKTVAAEAGPISVAKPKGCLSGAVDLFVGLSKAFLIFVGFLTGIILLIVFFAILIAFIATLFGLGGGLFSALPSFLIANHPVLATTSFLFVIGIPIAAMIYGLIAFFAKLKPLNPSVKWTFFFIWLTALVLFLSSGLRIDRDLWKNNNWNWGWTSSRDPHFIRGNGIASEKTYTMNEPVMVVDLQKYVFANLQIEQTTADTASLIISGDENLVDKINYDLKDGRLTLSSSNPFRSGNNLTIRLQTKDLKGIRSNIAGNIQMNRAFTGDELDISMSGPGNFHADSLYVRSLSVQSEGIGSVRLSGKTVKTRFNMSGVGSIDALELVSDSVYAYVKGVGSVKSNPVEFIEGQLQGIGKITYKEEPKVKNLSSEGIGKIGKE